MASIQFHVRHLPPRVITSNSWSDNKQKALGIHAAKEEISAEVMLAARAALGPDLPYVECCAIGITYIHTFKRPGDGLLRLTDPGNVGGNIAKAVIDALTPESKPDKNGMVKKAGLGIIPDDDWTHVKSVTLMVEKCDEIADEGIFVHIEELVAS